MFLVLFVEGSFGVPLKLKWKFKTNENFYIEKYTDQEILKNGQIIRRRGLKDLVDLNVYKLIKNGAKLEGIYRSYDRDLAFEDSNFKLSEMYKLDFTLLKNGEYIVPKEYIMPSIRSIPTFVTNPVNPGDMWQANGMEVFEFNPPAYVPVLVSYQYICDETNHNTDCAKISINYCIDYMLPKIEDMDIPYKYVGYSMETCWFDYKNGKPVYVESIYDIILIYPEGAILEYRGTLLGYYNIKKKLEEKEKYKLQDELAKKMPKGKDIIVKKGEKGLSVRLGEIYFEYNSDVLTQKGEEVLDSIGQVLKNYPGYEVIIEGHTDNIGTPEYNQDLSERRAENTLQHMIEQKYLDYKKGSYIGKGEKEPVESNATEQGRKKNRRVEIIIIPTGEGN